MKKKRMFSAARIRGIQQQKLKSKRKLKKAEDYSVWNASHGC